jgi:hypothetical protein
VLQVDVFDTGIAAALKQSQEEPHDRDYVPTETVENCRKRVVVKRRELGCYLRHMNVESRLKRDSN